MAQHKKHRKHKHPLSRRHSARHRGLRQFPFPHEHAAMAGHRHQVADVPYGDDDGAFRGPGGDFGAGATVGVS